MSGPVARMLPDGQRLHLQHGPIDLVIGADGAGRKRAFAAAVARFDTVLQELVDELPILRQPPGRTRPAGAVAKRMHDAVGLHSGNSFATLMASVAGAVADEVLAVMCRGADLTRAYVNNGGDIALYLHHDATFRLAIAGLSNDDLGRIVVHGRDHVRGVATSGRGGRSLTMGIADSVTVLAKTAAAADIAATLIANAVDLPGHAGVTRAPAHQIDPDSDLGCQAVVTDCASLPPTDIKSALECGAGVARRMKTAGQISGAALFLQGSHHLVGVPSNLLARRLREHA